MSTSFRFPAKIRFRFPAKIPSPRVSQSVATYPLFFVRRRPARTRPAARNNRPTDAPPSIIVLYHSIDQIMTVPPRHLFSRIILLGIAILCPSQCRISGGGGGGSGSVGVASALLVSAFSPSPPSHHHHGYASRRQPHQRHYAGCYHSSYPIQQLPIFHNHHSTSLIRRNHIISSSSSTTTTTTTTTTRLHSFFGLGPAEIAIVALASLVVIGPSKLLNFSKEAGNIAGKTAAAGFGEEWSEELKSIPEEFRKGVELGEIEARSRKAKVMENADMDDSRDDGVNDS